jgi:acetylglutamate synthase
VLNQEWRELLLLARVINGDQCHSNHRPIIIDTYGQQQNGQRGRQHSFRFEAAWLEEEGYKKVVEDVWGEAMNTTAESLFTAGTFTNVLR